MTDRTTRLGMIGCGLISHAHGRAARKSRLPVRFGACMSRNLETARAWAAEYGCDGAYDDLGEMLASERLDGVVIASPPHAHCAQILQSIDAGVRAVLCEKALVTSAGEAGQVWAACRAAGALVMEGFMYRHHPATQRLYELAAEPSNGPLDSIHAVCNMLDRTPADAAEPGWRRRAEQGGGIAYDFLCYPVDAACHLARMLGGGPPVQAVATGTRGHFDTIERLYGLLAFESGATALLESSRRAVLQQRLELRFANATLTVPFAFSPPGKVGIEISRSHGFLDRETVIETIVPEEENDGRLIDFPVFTTQMENFVSALRGERPPAVPLRDSVINACVTDALLEGMESGERRAVHLPGGLAR